VWSLTLVLGLDSSPSIQDAVDRVAYPFARFTSVDA
jgi:hypothetical protein